MHCVFMCALVYNMLCAVMHDLIYIYGKQRTLELESMIIGVRELLFISVGIMHH